MWLIKWIRLILRRMSRVHWKNSQVKIVRKLYSLPKRVARTPKNNHQPTQKLSNRKFSTKLKAPSSSRNNWKTPAIQQSKINKSQRLRPSNSTSLSLHTCSRQATSSHPNDSTKPMTSCLKNHKIYTKISRYLTIRLPWSRPLRTSTRKLSKSSGKIWWMNLRLSRTLCKSWRLSRHKDLRDRWWSLMQRRSLWKKIMNRCRSLTIRLWARFRAQ